LAEEEDNIVDEEDRKGRNSKSKKISNDLIMETESMNSARKG
jgi:hypothetical protein